MFQFILLILLVFVYMNFWFVLSLVKQRNDIVDVAWGLGFIMLCYSSIVLGQGFNPHSLLLMSLVTLWGLRLAFHIAFRNKSKKEDFRYKKWREEWGELFFVRSYLQVYLLQGALMVVIATAFIFSNLRVVSPITYIDIIGLLIWLIGFYFESVGDWQLSQFLKNKHNKGKLMTEGLWQFTRHPNYFGEVTMWWGIFLIAFINLDNIFIIIAPLTITVLILFVSGIPMLEKKYEGRKDFAEYKKKTSAFFPLPPKK